MNTGGNKYIAFFVGSEKSAIGGMETHAKYFYNHFLKLHQPFLMFFSYFLFHNNFL